MDPVDLQDSIAFDEPYSEPDGFGGVETGWSERYATRAHFRYLRGGETVQAARLQGEQPTVITIRNSAHARGITTDWRMRDTRRQKVNDQGDYTAGVFNITAVIETEDRRWIEITAVRGAAT